MRKIAGTLLFLLLMPLARAAVINVEFKFTPFVGDPAKDEKVKAVPGKAAVFINNIPFAEQEVREEEVPVLFEEHEIAPARLDSDELGRSGRAQREEQDPGRIHA